MELHLSQFMFAVVICLTVATFVWAILEKKYWIAAIPASIFLVTFAAMPVRTTAPTGGSTFESTGKAFQREAPDRVEREKPNFEQLREEQLNDLKERSEEIENEVNN